MTKESDRKIQQEIEKQSTIYLAQFAHSISAARDKFLDNLEQINIPSHFGGYKFTRTLRSFCEDKIILFTIECYLSCEGETLEISPPEMFQHLAEQGISPDDVYYYQK
ncbi:MAG: hypothetical protein AB4206_15755 [Xenococcaceae cyanobacterium]